MPIAPGSLLGNKYRIADSIGRGGMGEVFSARRVTDGVEVAVKVVSRRVVDSTLMVRLEREAVAARRVRSVYVPEVYDVDHTEEGELYLVMRRLHGVSLSQRLKDRGVISWIELRPIVEDVLQGLADAHAAGVVHRDLKPGNVFLEPVEAPTVPSGNLLAMAAARPSPERAIILDFGVCKLDASDGEKLTVTGESVGTITYMAPEQIRGASDVDARADLYSVALIVFEALTGRLPFEATGQMAILAEKLEGKPKRLRDFAQVSVPGALDALLSKGLARKPDDRFASALDMLRAIRLLGAATEQPKTPLALPARRDSAPPDTVLTAVSQVRAPTVGSKVGLALAGAAAVSALAVLAFIVHDVMHASALPVVEPGPPVSAASVPSPSTSVAVASSLAEAPALDLDAVVDAGAGKTPHVIGPRIQRPSGTTAPRHSGAHITTEPRY